MRHASLLFSLSFSLVALLAGSGQAQLTPTRLRCEYHANPLGTDATAPRLGWQFDSKRRGAMQSAYQVLVADSPDALRANRGTLWDSGKVVTDRSIQIAYAGQPLQSRQTVYWKVRTWDEKGRASGYSASARWEMGLLSQTDWKAQWVGMPAKDTAESTADVKWIWYPEGNPAQNAPAASRYFRSTFPLPADRGIKEAVFYGVADNSFRLSVNGKEAGRGDGWPAFTQIPIRDKIRVGPNVLAVEATNSDGPAGFAGFVRVTFTDGQTQRFTTGERWKAGHTAETNWTQPPFDDANWKNAAVLGTIGMAPWGTPALSGSGSPATYLRKDFDIVETVKRARVYASALGLYQLHLNGKRVGNDIFTPGWTDYRKRVQYQTYDVTEMVQTGRNAVGVVLGDGWYCGHVGLTGRQNYGLAPRALVQLEIEYTSGKSQTIATNGSWQASQGPILENDLLMGESYDARREMPGWNTADFPAQKWDKALAEPVGSVPPVPAKTKIVSPIALPADGKVPLVASCSDPVRKITELHPKSVTQKPAGAYIFDLGQNMVGWVRLRVRGQAGMQIRLRFAEMLNPDGSIYTTNLRGAKCTDYYTLKGGGIEYYEPTFTFHGFRYVELTGFPGEPSANAITGIVVSSASREAGQFACSNPMVNKLQSNIVWGQRGNYLEVPTDCPQRDERLGWMGDSQVFIRTATFNQDVSAFMTKWVQDLADAQSAAGGFSDVTPRIGVPNDGSPAWGDAGVIVPWTVYLAYDDKRLLEKHYVPMQRWIAYLAEANPDFLWRKRSGNNYGDWLNIEADTPRDIIGTAYFAYSTHLLSKIAKALGKNEDAAEYEALFQKIKAAFNTEFVHPDGRITTKDGRGNTQTCYVLALRFDLLPESLRPVAAKYLADDILGRAKGHLSTGFVGVSYLNPTLTDAGRLDIAYKLLLNDTFPSWGYSIKQGATTIWERWDGWTQEKGFQDAGMNSFNHYSLGSVGEWMYDSVAGIDFDPAKPGYKHSILRPRPGGGLTFARAAYDSIHGRIVSDWKLENGTLTWKVTVPANTTATLYVPAKSADGILENGKPTSASPGLQFQRTEDGVAVFTAGAGEYVFTTRQ